ncbi:MAG: hypothetical protein Q8L92_11500, partial [Rubrivivax sp.]|nr:hypothetical protein [Rubrivivax sp.]
MPNAVSIEASPVSAAKSDFNNRRNDAGFVGRLVPSLRRFSVTFLISSADTVDGRAGCGANGTGAGLLAAVGIGATATLAGGEMAGFATTDFAGAAFFVGAA